MRTGVSPPPAAVGVVQPLTVLGDDDEVLDPTAEPPVEVDPRLHREHHPRLQFPVVAGHDVRLLVDVEPDPVAGAVEERVAVPGVLDDIAGGPIDRLGGDARVRPPSTAAACAALTVSWTRSYSAGGSPSKTSVRV